MDYSSGSEDDSAYEDDGRGQAVSNQFLTPCSRNLNLSPMYVGDWKGKHAYREILQNQIDGILESFGLSIDQLKISITKFEKKDCIEVRILDAQTSRLCGFQTFKYDKDGLGVLRICNRDAWLCDRNFDFGGTTKRHKSNQAGKHGEGFKVAALVLRRSPLNHSVRIVTSGCYVNFNFNQYSMLVARTSEIAEKKLYKMREEFKEQEKDPLRQVLKARPWQDVSWEIGDVRHCKTALGAKTSTSKIPLRSFEEWLTVTTLINPPTDMIRTPDGNLIFDTHFAGKIFLRGLELENCSASGKDFRYGYDLMSGSTGRDRTSLSNASEESSLMARIWAHAIKQASEELERKQLVRKYVAMLERDDHAEVHKAKSRAARETVKTIWAHLHEEAASKSPSGFYYCAEHAEDNIQIINDCLQQTPMPLARNTWEMLSEHGLCRTPQEERHAKFRGLPAISVSELSSFGKTLLSLLRACLLADDHTADKHITIVDGGQLDVRTFYSSLSNTWKLEKKLFDFEVAHEGVFYCEATNDHGAGEDDAVFCCTHAVVDLFSNMLSDLKPNDLSVDTHSASAAEVKRLVSMARTRTSRVPQNVLVAPTTRGGEVQVTWESFETQYARKHSSFNYAITLHNAETCKDKSQYVLHKPGQRELCDCQPVRVSLAEDQYKFTGVNAGTGYFVTIRHDADVAIYATSINKCEVEAYREPSVEVAPLVEDTVEEDEHGNEIKLGGRAYKRHNRFDADGPKNNIHASSSPSSGYLPSEEDEHSYRSRTDLDEVRLCPHCHVPHAAHHPLRRSPSVKSGGLATADHSPPMVPIVRQGSVEQELSFTLGNHISVENIHMGEMLRRNWFEGCAADDTEGVWVAIPKDATEKHGRSDDGDEYLLPLMKRQRITID